MQPRIFISAVTRELGSTRQRVANILTRLGYEPVWEDIFGAEPGDLRPILRGKMDDCLGLIQLVGHAYGSEPPEPDAEFGRVSYTQFEFQYMRKLARKTWLIFPGDACTRDTALDELDRPRDPAHPDAAGFQAERRALQDAYRQRLRSSEHLYHDPQSDAELELTVERLEPELRKLNKGFRRWQTSVVTGLALLILLVVGGFWLTNKLAKKSEERQLAAQQVTKERIQAHLLEASEKRLAEDLAAADKIKDWEARERQQEAAQKAHASRVARIDELAGTFAELEGRPDASVVLRELTRILQEEGVEAALAYTEKQRPGVLERVRGRQATVHEENRADLQPLLQAAGLHAVKGDALAAHKQFREILNLEPDWLEALDSCVWFLFDQAGIEVTHGSLNSALDYSEEALGLAEHYAAQDLANTNALRALTAALNRRGDVLLIRGQPGDAEKALGHYQRSLEVSERLLAANTNSAQAARDVSVNLNKLGAFLAARGQPGDAEKALGHYQRSLEVSERLLAANTNSAQAARDVSVNLNKLGAFLAARGQPGDAEKALGHYQRSLEVRERLLAANTNSAQAARDVMVSHYKLHLFYRRQADEQKAAQSLKACFNILDSFVRAGRPMDAQMRRLYDQLKPQFSSGSNQPSQGHSDEHDPTAR